MHSPSAGQDKREYFLSLHGDFSQPVSKGAAPFRCNAPTQSPEVLTRVRDVSEWPQIRQDIMAIEQATFGAGAYTEHDFLDAAACPGAFYITQTEKRSGRVVGYALGVELYNHYEDPMYRYASGELYLMSIAIDKPFRGLGLLPALMGEFENHAKDSGYQSITMHAEVHNGFADKIERHYGPRIVSRYDHQSAVYGEQRYFKITI